MRTRTTREPQKEMVQPKRVARSRAVQAKKLSVGGGHDRYEREADEVARRVVAGQPVFSISRLNGRRPAGAVVAEVALPRGETGQALRGDVRQRLEPYFGRSLHQVRIHDSPAARQAAAKLGACAFTHKNHIWLGAGASQNDTPLLAHEMTHVVQQGYAAPRGGVVQRQTEDGETVQRFSVWGSIKRVGRAVGGAVVSGARAIGSGIRTAAESLLEMGRDALMAVVRRVAPDFARLIERDGIRNTLRNLLQRGMQSLFGGALDAIGERLNFSGLGERFSEAIGRFRESAGLFASDAWEAVRQTAGAVGSFMSSTFSPVIDGIRSVASTVSDFFSSIWDVIGAPIMDVLRRIGGTVWDGLVGFVRGIGRMFNAVKSALGGAWERVKGWFGIEAEDGTDEGGGIWEWIKEKAVALWDGIKEFTRPIHGPLRVIGTILVALSPAGPALALYHAWPHLRRAFTWIRQRWQESNLIVSARDYLQNDLLPRLSDLLDGMITGIAAAADWLIEKLDGVLERTDGIAERLGGHALLAPLVRLFRFVAGQFRRALQWARQHVRGAAGWIGRILRQALQFAQMLLRFLVRLAAIILNPLGIPGLLLGTLWLWLPDRLKGPIIDFILDILRRVLRLIPSNPLLGPLFPFLKAAMIGFFDRVRAFATARKVRVANKFANIAAGNSIAFFFGFLKGLAVGVWEAVIAPFQMIADLFELPQLICGFINALSEQFGALVAQARSLLTLIGARAADTLDSVLSAAGDLLRNPRRLIEMIQAAIEAALNAASGMGATLANRMMEIFEQPDEKLGEMLGNLTGGFIVEGIIAFFTAGSSLAASAVSRVVRLLRTVFRNLRRILGMIVDFLRPVMGFVRRIIGMFQRAGSAAGRVMGRIGEFIERVMAAFRRAFGRIGRRRRPSRRTPSRRLPRDRAGQRSRGRSRRNDEDPQQRRRREENDRRRLERAVRRLRPALRQTVRNGVSVARLNRRLSELRHLHRLSSLRLEPGRRPRFIARVNPRRAFFRVYRPGRAALNRITRRVATNLLEHPDVRRRAETLAARMRRREPVGVGGRGGTLGYVRAEREAIRGGRRRRIHTPQTISYGSARVMERQFFGRANALVRRIQRLGRGARRRLGAGFRELRGGGTYTDFARRLDAIGDPQEVAAAVMATVQRGRVPREFAAHRQTIAEFTHLMFGREAIRGQAALVTSPMLIDLVRSGERSWQQALVRDNPMAFRGAPAAARGVGRNLSMPEADPSITSGSRIRQFRMRRREIAVAVRWLDQQMRISPMVFTSEAALQQYIEIRIANFYGLNRGES